MRKLLSLFTILALIFSLSSPAFAQVEDRDCGDFATWREAQHFFNTNNPDTDPHDLDRDKDGIVCEGLPGFDVNYQAGTPLDDNADTDQGGVTDPADDQGDANDNEGNQGGITDPADDQTGTTDGEGAGLAKTATNYPLGSFIGLMAATIGFIIFFIKRKPSIN